MANCFFSCNSWAADWTTVIPFLRVGFRQALFENKAGNDGNRHYAFAENGLQYKDFGRALGRSLMYCCRTFRFIRFCPRK